MPWNTHPRLALNVLGWPDVTSANLHHAHRPSRRTSPARSPSARPPVAVDQCDVSLRHASSPPPPRRETPCRTWRPRATMANEQRPQARPTLICREPGLFRHDVDDFLTRSRTAVGGSAVRDDRQADGSSPAFTSMYPQRLWTVTSPTSEKQRSRAQRRLLHHRATASRGES